MRARTKHGASVIVAFHNLPSRWRLVFAHAPNHVARSATPVRFLADRARLRRRHHMPGGTILIRRHPIFPSSVVPTPPRQCWRRQCCGRGAAPSIAPPPATGKATCLGGGSRAGGSRGLWPRSGSSAVTRQSNARVPAAQGTRRASTRVDCAPSVLRCVQRPLSVTSRRLASTRNYDEKRAG